MPPSNDPSNFVLPSGTMGALVATTALVAVDSSAGVTTTIWVAVGVGGSTVAVGGIGLEVGVGGGGEVFVGVAVGVVCEATPG